MIGFTIDFSKETGTMLLTVPHSCGHKSRYICTDWADGVRQARMWKETLCRQCADDHRAWEERNEEVLP